MIEVAAVDAALREAEHICRAAAGVKERTGFVDHERLLLDMHGDLKVVRQGVDDAKKVAVDTRQQLMNELNDLKEELKQTRHCVANQKNEITRIKTTFGIIAAILAAAWSAVLIWVQQMTK